MNKDFLIKFRISKFHFDDPNGGFAYRPEENDYFTDGHIDDKVCKDGKSMYLENASWLIISKKDNSKRELYTLIDDEKELETIFRGISKFSEKETGKNSKEEARIRAIHAKLNSINRRRVSSVKELTGFITKFHSIFEKNIDYFLADMGKANDFIDPGATTHFEEFDDKVDFYLLSRTGEKLLIMRGSYN